MLGRLVLASALTAALLVAAACSNDGGSPPATADLTRVSEGGGVTVEASWVTEAHVAEVEADLSRYPLDEYVLLHLKLDTHSGDLNEVDLEKAGRLRQGGAEVPPLAWVSVDDDSHHREGLLAFPKQLRDGPVELVLEDIGGLKERILLWQAVPIN